MYGNGPQKSAMTYLFFLKVKLRRQTETVASNYIAMRRENWGMTSVDDETL